MKLPRLKHGSGIRRSGQVAFGGLNHTEGAADGELWDMENLTSDHFPLLASRPERGIIQTLTNGGGIFSWEGLVTVDGTGFYYKGQEKGQVAEGQKTFAAMGSWVVIFPDKKAYNVDTEEFVSMESRWSGSEVSFQDGILYGQEAKANAIYKEGVNWAELFRAGDAVTISGCTVQPGNNRSIIIRAIDGDKLYFYEHSFQLGEEDQAYRETGEVSIARTVPDLKFLCENENRLWGCVDDTIYASKLGDIFNWNVYDGLDTDAWAVDTGSAGKFTGCVSFQGYPIFFKEDHIYKIYGSMPSNFDVLGSATMGLAAGSERSLAVAGETLFYLGRNGVTAYTGGIPRCIGAAFGLQRFYDAAAGTDGMKYYISMRSDKGRWGLYVYDTRTGQWHREDDLQVRQFAWQGGRLYMLAESGKILATDWKEEDSKKEGIVPWFAEFSDFTENSPDKKRVGKIQIRLELDRGAFAMVQVMYDSSGMWEKVGEVICQGEKRSCYLPVRIRRCDHYRIRIRGKGGCLIHSLAREYNTGSPR